MTATGDLSGTTAAILAGGQGTRLRPVIADRPKALAEVRGRPFLAYLLTQLASTGIRRVVLCTGHKGEQIRARFGDFYDDLRLVYSQESSLLGTAGALRLALPMIKSDPVLVMNGDSFCDVDLRDCHVQHRARGAAGTLVLTRVSDTQRYGHVHIGADCRVLRFDEKVASNGPGWINAGIYYLDRTMVEKIQPGVAVSLEKDVFPAWIGRGLHGYPSVGRFLDIGTPDSFEVAERFFT